MLKDEIKKKSIKKTQKSPESTDETRDPNHETRITSWNTN